MEIKDEKNKIEKRTRSRSRRITKIRRLIEEFLRKEASDIDIEIIWKFVQKILGRRDK